MPCSASQRDRLEAGGLRRCWIKRARKVGELESTTNLIQRQWLARNLPTMLVSMVIYFKRKSRQTPSGPADYYFSQVELSDQDVMTSALATAPKDPWPAERRFKVEKTESDP